jgi:hypothetical protein
MQQVLPAAMLRPQSERGTLLAILAIPADMSVANLCTFCAAYLVGIREMRVLRRKSAQRSVCMVLIRRALSLPA